MVTKNTLDAQIYAFKKHAHQIYDEGTPYTIHLVMVNTMALRYLHLIPFEEREQVVMALWLHDVREDLGVSYNEIKQLFGEEVAEIVYCLTNNDGRTRSEKAINTYGPKTATNRLAVFGKLADRMGNVCYGELHESSMLKKQAIEFEYMVEILFIPGEYDELWNDLADKLKRPRPTGLYHSYILNGPKYYPQTINVQ